jgi:Uma2 family endonuclease
MRYNEVNSIAQERAMTYAQWKGWEIDGNLAVKPGYKFPVFSDPVRWDPEDPESRRIDTQKTYTFEEYEKLNLPGDNKYELRNGKIYMMSIEKTIHAELCRRLYNKIDSFLDGKPCQVFSVGLGVRLEPREDKKDTEQLVPDLAVVCDMDKMKTDGYNGPPKMIIEVLSPSTASSDRVYKRNRYEQTGVEEYWIVAPNEKTVETFVMKNGSYQQKSFCPDWENPDASIPVAVLPGLSINLAELFAE